MLKVKMVFVFATSSHLACVPVWGEERVLFQAPFCFSLVQRTCSLTLGATAHLPVPSRLPQAFEGLHLAYS